jgi:imidazole glycerol-phosphate synthase subunit HisH
VSDVLILDLGYGNTRSVALAFKRLGADPILSSDPTAAEQAGRLVVPGVGAAAVAMERLQRSGLDAILRRRTGPTLGVCLGMQLMFERSDEDGGTETLGLLPGTVTGLRSAPGHPVPHMGWSKVTAGAGDIGIDAGDYLYFAHSFVCPDGPQTIASAAYGDAKVPAVVRRGAWWGAQFHPERSSAPGSRFLQAFLQS